MQEATPENGFTGWAVQSARAAPPSRNSTVPPNRPDPPWRATVAVRVTGWPASQGSTGGTEGVGLGPGSGFCPGSGGNGKKRTVFTARDVAALAMVRVPGR